MRCDIVLAGVGGQGTVLASRLIALCAMKRGLEVKTAETIGMAQRGGCVVSHVRIGNPVFSPLVPKGGADLLFGLEPGEAVRCLQYLKEGGGIVASSKAVMPISSSLAGGGYSAGRMLDYLRGLGVPLAVVDADMVAQACGEARALNVALLGAAAASGMLFAGLGELEAAIREAVPSRHVGANLKALAAGAEHCEIALRG